jgi:hypothetical protein
VGKPSSRKPLQPTAVRDAPRRWSLAMRAHCYVHAPSWPWDISEHSRRRRCFTSKLVTALRRYEFRQEKGAASIAAASAAIVRGRLARGGSRGLASLSRRCCFLGRSMCHRFFSRCGSVWPRSVLGGQDAPTRRSRQHSSTRRLPRRRVARCCRAHNPEVAGSSPAPLLDRPETVSFCLWTCALYALRLPRLVRSCPALSPANTSKVAGWDQPSHHRMEMDFDDVCGDVQSSRMVVLAPLRGRACGSAR